MEDFLQLLHNMLNTAYIIMAFLLGLWSTVQAGRNRPIGLPADSTAAEAPGGAEPDDQSGPGIISGQFLGAMAVHTILAGGILALAGLMALLGTPAARWVYYLYGVFFIIVLPGTFSLMRGRDDRTAALIYAIVVTFAGAAATRVPLLTGW